MHGMNIKVIIPTTKIYVIRSKNCFHHSECLMSPEILELLMFLPLTYEMKRKAMCVTCQVQLFSIFQYNYCCKFKENV